MLDDALRSQARLLGRSELASFAHDVCQHELSVGKFVLQVEVCGVGGGQSIDHAQGCLKGILSAGEVAQPATDVGDGLPG
ncbi:MAG TPA: hypothetical protein DGT21_00795 [Armatimonadetes bacterium]|nr:hypothetical protein [Armatimonadota bacterium]